MAETKETKAKRGTRGLGSVYQRGPHSWWISYPGRQLDPKTGRRKRISEPGGKTKTAAVAKLRQRNGEIATDRYAGPEVERLVVRQLLDDYVDAKEVAGAKSLASIRSHLKTIRAKFDAHHAVDVTTAQLRRYQRAQQRAGLKDATIDRALEYLRAAYNLARKEAGFPAARIPHFPLFKTDNTRRNWITEDQHEAIKSKLQEPGKRAREAMGTDNPYADVAEAGWLTAWRSDELLGLTWATDDNRLPDGARGVVDRAAGKITLWVTKSGEPRTWPLRKRDGRLTKVGRLIEKRWRARRYTSTNGWKTSRFVFHVSGHKLWRFGRLWRLARAEAGCPGANFHDYRRAVARRLQAAGIPETTIMKMCGWKTRSMFRRYVIVSDDDILDALERDEQHDAGRVERIASGQ